MADPGRYRDAFEEHLAAVLSGELAGVRQRLFMEWLERLPFLCEGCGLEEFEVSAGDVDESDLIVCQKCQKVHVG